jgi:hypothetical protein
MKNFLCEFHIDKTRLTHKILKGAIKNIIAAQQLTFHVTVPRCLSTIKKGYQQGKAIHCPIELNLFSYKNFMPRSI